MVVKFFGPFRDLAAREATIELDEPISTRKMLGLLAERYQGFSPYADEGNEAKLFAHVMFLRNGTPLKMADRIEDTDQIDVVLPVTGG